MSTHESKRKQSPKSEGRGKPARSPNLITWLAMASCALALTACGGGEASADAPQGPGGVPSTDPGNTPSVPAAVAPTIAVAPASVAVSTGNWAQFSVVASGTAPLVYRWFRDGQVIADANADTLQLQADSTIPISGQRITVEVSNAAGRVVSEVAVFSVASPVTPTPVPAGANEVQTLVPAAKGGVVAVSESEEAAALIVPPGTLASDTRIRFATNDAAVSGLPAGMESLGETITVSGTGLAISPPARLSLPAPDYVPEGHVLAVLVYTGTAQPLHTQVGDGLKLAQSVRGLEVGAAPEVRCVTAQDSRNGDIQVDVAGEGSWVVAAVLPEQCMAYGTLMVAQQVSGMRQAMSVRSQATAAATGDAIPSSSTAPCSEKEWALAGTAGRVEVSRHVQCIVWSLDGTTIYDMKTGDQLGVLHVELRLGIHGQSNKLSKNIEASARAYWMYKPEAGKNRPSSVPVKIEIGCSAVDNRLDCSPPPILLNISPQASAFRSIEVGWTQSKGVVLKPDWDKGAQPWEFFHFVNTDIHFARVGGNIDKAEGRFTWWGLSTFSNLRCDNGLQGETGSGGREGCVFSGSPAVFVLSRGNDKVKETSRHIQEAQISGKPGAYRWSSLYRSWMPGLEDLNRDASCKPSGNSVIVQNPASGGTCGDVYKLGSGCDCDEYPFASTWNGGYQASTSARYIPAGDNRSAGARLGIFYRRERVLDLTPKNLGVNATIRWGDEFWVHIEP